MLSTLPAPNPALVWADVGCIGGGAEAEPEPSPTARPLRAAAIGTPAELRPQTAATGDRRLCRATQGESGRLGRTALPVPSPLASASAGGPGGVHGWRLLKRRRRRLLRRNGRDRRDSVTRRRMNPGSCTTRRKLDRGWNRQSSLVLQALFAARFTGAGRRAQLSARPTAKENAPICPRHTGRRQHRFDFRAALR